MMTIATGLINSLCYNPVYSFQFLVFSFQQKQKPITVN
jgi:hypothetical protein